ncbi:Putative Polygalacturonase [Rhizopus microsporus]|nr:Putative Polygalacturonase [Rhizopus microsporus]
MVQLLSLSSTVAAFLLLSLGINDVAAAKTCVVAKTGNDDTAAIVKAFNDCKTGGIVSFPKGKSYNLNGMIELSGLKDVTIDFQGQIVLPGWDKKYKGGNSYISIKGSNIHMSGGGTIVGNGQGWYDRQDHTAPTVIRFGATNSVFGNFKILNAPRAHMGITGSNNVVLENIYLNTASSSKNPPKNTDALDISSSSNIIFRNSELNVGDDCTAINGGVTNVTLSHIKCNGGHGFSVGSLGKGGKQESVKLVRVLDSVCTNCQNGVRIKTWPGGKGVVQDVVYKNVQLNNVENPVIVTTHYCDKNQMSFCTKNNDSSLSISKVTFDTITGSVAGKKPAISIDCSKNTPCSGFTLSNVNIKSNGAKNICNNLSGSNKISYCS